MKKKFFSIFILLALSSVGWSHAKPLNNVYTISELNQLKPAYGTYNTTGYVAKIYECPRCPKGAVCKPCQPAHMVISETKPPLTQKELTDKEMIVFIDNSDGLKSKKKYNFLIKILDVKTTDQIVNNPKLIYFQGK